MTSPAQLLADAGQHLTAAEALITRAAAELGPPFAGALERIAVDLVDTRRRLRNAATTATASRK